MPLPENGCFSWQAFLILNRKKSRGNFEPAWLFLRGFARYADGMTNDPDTKDSASTPSPPANKNIFRAVLLGFEAGLLKLWRGEVSPGIVFVFGFVGGLGLLLRILEDVPLPDPVRWTLFLGWMLLYVVCQWRSAFKTENNYFRVFIRATVIFLCLFVLAIVRGCQKMV
jgi:hypothetical protein